MVRFESASRKRDRDEDNNVGLIFGGVGSGLQGSSFDRFSGCRKFMWDGYGRKRKPCRLFLNSNKKCECLRVMVCSIEGLSLVWMSWEGDDDERSEMNGG
ncbi:hypothetical protein L1987_25306 [Smallanthus sonchifolius]|uniref:Uncharacterized protein n=1 Tax=Smallanthus sonchifolius TaxID=185202 RepID=A0ACB9IPB5_9ASTR|nr:hypothetical protein L1987_25306 [Smallanthus sonchifolius]